MARLAHKDFDYTHLPAIKLINLQYIYHDFYPLIARLLLIPLWKFYGHTFSWWFLPVAPLFQFPNVLQDHYTLVISSASLTCLSALSLLTPLSLPMCAMLCHPPPHLYYSCWISPLLWSSTFTFSCLTMKQPVSSLQQLCVLHLGHFLYS